MQEISTAEELVRLGDYIWTNPRPFVRKIIECLIEAEEVSGVRVPAIDFEPPFGAYGSFRVKTGRPTLSISGAREIDPIYGILEKYWGYIREGRELEAYHIALHIVPRLYQIVRTTAHEFVHYMEYVRGGLKEWRRSLREEEKVPYRERPSQIKAWEVGVYYSDIFRDTLKGLPTIFTPVIEQILRR